MNNLMENYTKGSEYIDKIILKSDSPYLYKLLDRIYDRWDTTERVYDRWSTMNKWVQQYKNGASFDEMMNCSEAESYGKWWSHNQTSKTSEEINNRKKQIVDMIISIANNGYNENDWLNTNGWCPIKVSIDGMGTLWTFDGAHRTMILAALGIDIPAKIEFIRTNFLESILPLSMLYQPSSHPCVQNLKVIRKDFARYQAVCDVMSTLNIKTACEIGCAEGEGLIVLAKNGVEITGIENDESRLTLSRSLCEVTKKAKVRKQLNAVQYDICDACIGLSVWHHLAQDLKSLNKCVDLTKNVKFQFVEMPEHGSKTFQQQLIDDTGWNWEDVGEKLTQHIMDRGGYKKSEVVYVDEKYANRKTILLSK